jgi:hypothetical protein
VEDLRNKIKIEESKLLEDQKTYDLEETKVKLKIIKDDI